MTRNEPDSTSLDLLLDTITNTFGGILFVTILVVLQLRVSSVVVATNPNSSQSANLRDELRRRKDEVGLLSQVSASQQKSLEQLSGSSNRRSLERLAEQRQRLQGIVSEQARVLAEVGQIVAKTSEVQERLQELQAQMTQEQILHEDLRKALDQENRRRTRTAELPTLRATDKREFPVIVKYGRLYTPYRIDPVSLLRSHDLDDFQPLGELEKTDLLSPLPFRGIPLDGSTDCEAALSALWDDFPKASAYVCLAVWDDSFSEFATLKEALVHRDIEYRLIPVVEGETIGEGPSQGAFVQ